MGPPLIIVTILAVLYARFGDLEVLGRILAGITAAADRSAYRGGRQNGYTIVPQTLGLGASRCNRRLYRRRHHAMAAAVGVCGACAG